MLRGAAIALLPVNFMTVALLSHDERVPHKMTAVAFLALIYLVFGGWGLWRWCGVMHPSLGKLLGSTLLLINLLVLLAPMAQSSAKISNDGLNAILGTDFISASPY